MYARQVCRIQRLNDSCGYKFESSLTRGVSSAPATIRATPVTTCQLTGSRSQTTASKTVDKRTRLSSI